MNSIIINKDFRITIPKEVRKKYDFKPGQKFELFNTGYSIKLIPLK
ncbi:MAG: AbrB/MazE/SpoVT family DNA-binding domain-containing protein [archaeon]|nr:AbrB/MazE/SpoVT family DNA-binding domain-containing protein [archaeon]